LNGGHSVLFLLPLGRLKTPSSPILEFFGFIFTGVESLCPHSADFAPHRKIDRAELSSGSEYWAPFLNCPPRRSTATAFTLPDPPDHVSDQDQKGRGRRDLRPCPAPRKSGAYGSRPRVERPTLFSNNCASSTTPSACCRTVIIWIRSPTSTAGPGICPAQAETPTTTRRSVRPRQPAEQFVRAQR
jgi:hypothetical protein